MARLRGADPLVGALGRHLALAGFMGAGKSTVGARVAELTARPFVDLDRLIERRHGPIPSCSSAASPSSGGSRRGCSPRRSPGRSRSSRSAAAPSLAAQPRAAARARVHRLPRRRRRDGLGARARVGPAARQREDDFRKLYESRQELYAEAADAVAEDADDVLLAALAIEPRRP